MALLKVTAATALPTLRQLITEMAKSLKESGPLSALDPLARNLETLDGFCHGRLLDVEVVHSGALTREQVVVAATWIGSVPTAVLTEPGGAPVITDVSAACALRLHGRSLAAPLPLSAGSPRPPVLVVFAVAALDEDARQAVERAAQDRPLVLLVGATDDPSISDLQRRLAAVAGVIERLDLATLGEPTLAKRLLSPPWEGAFDVLRAHSAVLGLESISAAYTMVLEQQSRELKVKRAVSQQRLTKFQQKTPASSGPSDLLVEVKTKIQRLAGEFDRGVSDRLQDLVGVPVGTLYRDLETRLHSLRDLDHEVKTSILATRVPAAFEAEMNALVRERLATHCSADLVSLNDLLRMVAHEVERTLAEAEGPPLVLQFTYLTEERIRRLLASYAVFQSQYKGEMQRPGFSEYFSSVRKYSMVLVMGASMFGASSFIRQYREITIPLTIVLVLYGTFSVMLSTRRERIESLERELDAARTSMRADVKRILADVQKQWSSILTQHLNEQTAAAVAQVDTAFKEHQVRKGAEATPERERLQRQVQTLDTAEKKVGASTKSRDSLTTSIAQLRAELRHLLPTRVQAAAPAPAPKADVTAKPVATEPSEAQVSSALAEAKARLETLKNKAANAAGASSARERLTALKSRAAAGNTPSGTDPGPESS